MTDYISREALQNAVERNCDMQDLYLPIHFLQIADEIPAAYVREVVHGKNVSESGFLCSVCEFGDFGGFHGYNPHYCPNCGARMDGDGE